MPKSRTRDRVGEDDVAAIIAAVARYPGGAGRENIAAALPRKLASRTLQFWLKNLVESGRLTSKGVKRAVKYHVPPPRSSATFSSPSKHGNRSATTANFSTATDRMCGSTFPRRNARGWPR